MREHGHVFVKIPESLLIHLVLFHPSTVFYYWIADATLLDLTDVPPGDGLPRCRDSNVENVEVAMVPLELGNGVRYVRLARAV